MYTIRSIDIEGFWHRHEVRASFNNEVNVIIGRNGTGKTTFMNILHGVLSVDLDVLQQNQFDTATIILVNESGQKKTIKSTRVDNQNSPFAYIEFLEKSIRSFFCRETIELDRPMCGDAQTRRPAKFGTS